jgi:hypothetical protein
MALTATTFPCSLEIEVLPDGVTEIEIRQGPAVIMLTRHGLRQLLAMDADNLLIKAAMQERVVALFG